MTTRNFRVNNGLSIGDIVISATANTITGLATSAPSADGDVANKKYVDDGLAGLSQNSISQGNSSVTVTDSGTGAIAIAVDGSTVINTVAAGATVTGTLTSTSTGSFATGTTVGNLTLANGSITDSSGAISFENENLTTTGSVNGAAGNFTGAVGVDGNFDVATNKLTVNATTGNTLIAGTLDVTGSVTASGDLRIAGNLTVDGTETIINTQTLSIEDAIIEVNRNVSSNAGMPSISGMKVNRGEGSTATEQDLYWAWDETFADDGTTLYGNAGGAWTAFKRAEGDNSNPGPADLADIRANVVHATSTSAQYADVAERFASDAPMTAGAVVTIGGTHEITESTTDLSENVFGVISDMPAYAMNAAAGNNESHPFVAMTGRTPVRTTGAVTKGQRLVTSSVKGCARAVAIGESISPFNVIGRALETNTDEGIKLVNCAVRTNN